MNTKPEEQQTNEVTNNIEEEEGKITEETEATIIDDQYFTKSKLERDSMYSQILETYQKIYNDTNSNSDQKNQAMKEIANINNIKNGTMIAENLITAKGFEDVVIFVNNSSTSVVIKGKDLPPEQIAQIQNIVSREINSSIESIHISTK